MLTYQKKVSVFLLGLICFIPTLHAMEKKQKNPFFNLEDCALKAVLEVAPVNKDTQLLSKLEQAKKSDFGSLPWPFIDVIQSNIGWAAIRSVGLEQKKINLLTCEQMSDFNQTLLSQLQKDYHTEFKLKHDKFTNEECKIHAQKAVEEAIDTLINFLKSAVSSVVLENTTVTLFKTDNTNKNVLVKQIDDMYQSEGCGICEKKGADVFWFSPYSRCAHKSCYELIKGIEQKLDKFMQELFKDDKVEINFAHVAIIEAVRKACGCPILEYVQKNSPNALEKLYYTVGEQALHNYCLNEDNF